jgi:Tol biopolymer transport system component
VEGGPEVQIGSSEYPKAYPFPGPFLAWTPDGRSLIVLRKSGSEVGGQGMWSVPLSGGEPHWLVPPREQRSDDCPAFSPNGRTLAFVRYDEGFHEVWLQSLTASLTPEGPPRRLTDLKLLTSHPTWTPDGQSVVFSAGGWVRSFLWRALASGAEKPVQLTALGDDVTRPTISPTGQLVYEQGHNESDLWTADLSGATPPRRIVSANREDLAAHYSPDGRRIVFISSRSGENEVWVANADGTQPLRLTSMKAGVTGWPSFSPDGTRVLFDSNLTGHYHLYTISAAGGEAVQLTSGPWADGVARWSHDGKWIFFLSSRSGTNQLWRMPADGGEAVQITRHGARLGMESRDGPLLYYAKDGEDESAIWRVPILGGEEVRVLEHVHPFMFVPVPGGLYHRRFRPDGWELILHTWADGRDKVVLSSSLRGMGPGLDVSPDGRTVLYSQREPASSDLKLVQLPR